MIIAQLDRTEEQVARVINGGGGEDASRGQIDIAALLREANQRPEEDENDPAPS